MKILKQITMFLALLASVKLLKGNRCFRRLLWGFSTSAWQTTIRNSAGKQ